MGSRIGALQIGCGWMVSGQDEWPLASAGISEDEDEDEDRVEDSNPRVQEARRSGSGREGGAKDGRGSR